MKKTLMTLLIPSILLAISPLSTSAEDISYNKVKFALIRSLSPSIEITLEEIYKNTKEGVLSWAGWDTELLEVRQLYGVGGAYDVKVRIHPFYGPHIGNGYSDEITVRLRSDGQSVLSHNHLKDF